MSTIDLISLDIQQFIAFLREAGIRRFCFVRDPESGEIRASHDVLQPVADFIAADRRDYLQHEGAFVQISSAFDMLHGAFVHRTNRGQAAGGVRYWNYDTVEGYLRDGLRLAKGMTRKNALAGLWWGGGKGVISHNPAVDKYDSSIREILYREYGSFMSSLQGCYVTAEDVGTNVADMANVFSRTRFTTCIPHELGGSGNPSVPTARGVICGIEAALAFLEQGSIEGKTVAIQGVGNVGEPLIRFLLEKNVGKIIAWDINRHNVDRVKSLFGDTNIELHVVQPGDFSMMGVECDILCPCATGAVLNPGTISTINARIVCGAANNQLEDSGRDDALLQEAGILYVPDFLTNRMGIVNCANEDAGYVNGDPIIERHFSRDWEHSIYRMCTEVLAASRETGDPPGKVAIRLADGLSLQSHPVFGHRGVLIIKSLMENRWFDRDAV